MRLTNLDEDTIGMKKPQDLHVLAMGKMEAIRGCETKKSPKRTKKTLQTPELVRVGEADPAFWWLLGVGMTAWDSSQRDEQSQ